MKIRPIGLAAVAWLTTAAAFARAPVPEPAEPQPAVGEPALLEELAADMRALLIAVAPEISLPALELTPPTLDADFR